MKRILTFSAAVIACAAFFGSAGSAAAKDYAYCRRDVSAFMVQCGFDTLAQCQDMNSGRGGDCIRNPSLGEAASAYAYAPIARKHHQK